LSGNKGFEDLLAASYWCNKAILMTAGSGEANRDGPQGLLRRGRALRVSIATILNKSGKILKSVEEIFLQFRIKKRKVLSDCCNCENEKKTRGKFFDKRAALNTILK
jgi:hypothetical protein